MGVLPMPNLKLSNFISPSRQQPVIPITFKTPNVNTSLSPLSTCIALPNNNFLRKQQVLAVSTSSLSANSNDRSELEALIFDCDGVILESEYIHRNAYNAAFAFFNVCCPTSSNLVVWDEEFYDQLQNQIGGGKPKMRWYFNKNGWPSSTILKNPPSNDSEKSMLIDTIQDWKTEKYKEIIRSGEIKPRPGVLQLMDEGRASGVKLAVCSAATKSSVVLCLESLLGLERFQQLDCFLAGDDVQTKKPAPTIYLEAAKRLGVSVKNCLVIEDSVIGLQAAVGAGMACVISYTSSTKDQDFASAKAIYPDMGNVHLEDVKALLQDTVIAS
ncbi:hypothetical protein SUGI_0517560 [Cryptomeria japonica]|uniref:haloacid dehalogenase-like hydrolase domain-containing protein At4g39970 n=1 Tax=Cryptomeria japonica TaxID=3369 RepID=UPI002408DD01|nr:haloacid dehalogenase-like hydrolase domain-containing protein At4g39970 [Cryptomeria japonica]GLJ26627.1 hypothetical protein SUGI_0517560 [Cryptomeria japonica]